LEKITTRPKNQLKKASENSFINIFSKNQLFGFRSALPTQSYTQQPRKSMALEIQKHFIIMCEAVAGVSLVWKSR
jgi:hypothetical protein